MDSQFVLLVFKKEQHQKPERRFDTLGEAIGYATSRYAVPADADWRCHEDVWIPFVSGEHFVSVEDGSRVRYEILKH